MKRKKCVNEESDNKSMTQKYGKYWKQKNKDTIVWKVCNQNV